MATYIQGLTQYLPQIQPFQRDFNFYANVMQKKQTEYDSGHEQINKLYGSVFYSDVSRGDMKERKDEILKAIDFNLKKVSALDVSLKQNQRQAQQVFRPFYEDKELMKDIVYTKTYQQEMQRGLSAKECVGKDCPETYWDGGIRLLEHQMKKFKNSSLEDAMQMRNPSYTPYFNMMKEAQKIAKENKFEIVNEGPRNGYMVKEINGPNAIMPLHNFLLENFSNDPRAIDFYNAKAQLSFYDNPEKTINQYELLKLRQSAKDDEDYKRMLEEKSKQLEFNKSKNTISAAEAKTKKEAAVAKDRRKVFQDYANEMGALFQASPAKNDYEQVIRDEEVKSKTYNDVKDLNDQVKDITYFDSEGKPIQEHVITSLVAQGMLLEDSLGAAKSIANLTYKQTISGADPYALARYKNSLAKSLELYKSDLRLYEGAISGGSTKSGKSKESGYLPEELTFEEEEKIRKETETRLTRELGDNISQADKDKAFEEAKAQELANRYQNNRQIYNQKVQALNKAAERGSFTQEQAQALTEVLENDAQNLDKFRKDIMSISATEPTQSYSVQTDIAQNPIGLLPLITAMTEVDPSRFSVGFMGGLMRHDQPHIVTYTDPETGKETKHKLTGQDFRQIFTNTHLENLSILRQSIDQADVALKSRGQEIASKVVQAWEKGLGVEHVTGIETGKAAAVRNILRGVGIDLDVSKGNRNPHAIASALTESISQNPEAYADYFMGVKHSPETMRLFETKRPVKGTEDNPLYSELTVGAKTDVPYDVWTNEYQARQIGLTTTDLIDIRMSKHIKEKATNVLNSYLENVKEAQQSQAEVKLLGAATTELGRITSLKGEYSLLKNPIKESYVKIGNEFVKSTEPTTVKEAFNMTLQDVLTDPSKGLDFLSSIYKHNKGYDGFTAQERAVNPRFILTPDKLQQLDPKTLYLLDQNNLIYQIGSGNQPLYNESIFERDENNNLIFKEGVLDKINNRGGFFNTNYRIAISPVIFDYFYPNEDHVTNAEFQRIQSTTKVKGHIHRGIYSGTEADNDFATAGFNLRNSFTINNVPKDALVNSRNSIDLAEEQFLNRPYIDHPGTSKKNTAVVQIQNANGEWVNAPSGVQGQLIQAYKNLFSRSMSESAGKLSTADAPSITQTLIPYSELGTGYGIVEFRISENGEGLQKVFKLVTPEKKSSFKEEDLKAKGINEIQNIRIHIPTNEYEPFIQSRKNLAFTTMNVGDKLGDLKDFNSEVSIDSVDGETIKYTIKYNHYYVDAATNEVKMQVVEKEETYNMNANTDYFDLMKAFLMIGSDESKNTRDIVRSKLK